MINAAITAEAIGRLSANPPSLPQRLGLSRPSRQSKTRPVGGAEDGLSLRDQRRDVGSIIRQ